MSGFSPAGVTLIRLMTEAPRGPRREGAFALWLVVRLAEDLLLAPPQPDRAARRRAAALGQRLSSLTLPAPLRRALGAAVAALEEPKPGVAPIVLQQLVAPARETLGPEAADALAKAARAAKSAGS
ncbi:MAG: hypothetical protein ACRENB_02000 [Gemmatimonadales bacterium]